MILLFNKRIDLLVTIPEIGNPCFISCFKACNNVDSTSKGNWPEGIFKSDQLVRVDGEESLPSGRYGRWFLRFENFNDNGTVRTGMGLHSGRKGVPDKRGREGYKHATMGCIRTEMGAMEYIAERWTSDPVSKLSVIG